MKIINISLLLMLVCLCGCINNGNFHYSPVENINPRIDILQMRKIKELKMNFIYVKSGKFIMGKELITLNIEPLDHYTIKTALRIVPQDYWILDSEITQEQYSQVMGNNNLVNNLLPATGINWTQATLFCKKLTQQEKKRGRLPLGYEYRLPTEVEWEYAARGGEKSRGFKYAGSNDICRVGWTDTIHKIKQKQCNELGIYDMSGNAWEWCLDSVRSKNTQTKLIYKIIRGGIVHNLQKNTFCVMNRHCIIPMTGVTYRSNHDCTGFSLLDGILFNDLGFRPVLAPIIINKDHYHNLIPKNRFIIRENKPCSIEKVETCKQSVDNMFFRVFYNDHYYFINNSGKVVLGRYTDAEKFFGGFALVQDKQFAEYSYINTQGTTSISFAHHKFYPCKNFYGKFDNNIFCVYIKNEKIEKDKFKQKYRYYTYKYGYINKSGKLIIPCKWDVANPFKDGFAVVGRQINGNKKYGVIDCNGKLIISTIYDYIGDCGSNLFAIKKGSKYGYIDQDGNVVLKCKYDIAGNFYNGLATVKIDGKWGCINRKGEFVIPNIYKQLQNNGTIEFPIAFKNKSDKWGYLDKNNNIVIPAKFAYATTFVDGVATVQENLDDKQYRWRYINPKGMEILHPNGKQVVLEDYYDGVGVWRELKSNNSIVLNKNGKQIWPPKRL